MRVARDNCLLNVLRFLLLESLESFKNEMRCCWTVSTEFVEAG